MIRIHPPLYPHIPCRLGSVAGSAVACGASSRVCASAESIPCLLGSVAGQSVCGTSCPSAGGSTLVSVAEDTCRVGGTCPIEPTAEGPRRICPTPGRMACKFRR